VTSRERVETALRGGRPDRVPTAAIYDIGYTYRSLGRDQRDFFLATPEEHDSVIEQSFLLHDVDAFFVHPGTNGHWAKEHAVEKFPDYWLVTVKATGERFRLLPDGCRAEADGTPVRRNPSADGVSRIQAWADLDALVAPPLTEAEIEATGRWSAMRRLVSKYPDRHFSFQSGSPMVMALGCCGGYVEALTTLATDRDLYRELLARCARRCAAFVGPGARTGAHSTWFTSYYPGADTISPRDYADLVFPYERQVCQAARDAGLFVLNWFLGDLMPILDKVMELPIDALVLEQGRKGYTIDPVEIRRRVGPRFCLFGFGYENDYCEFNRDGLTREAQRQIEGAGRDGAFVAGTSIMPPNARPEAVDFYFREVRRLGKY
jgi:hypothetical protein